MASVSCDNWSANYCSLIKNIRSPRKYQEYLWSVHIIICTWLCKYIILLQNTLESLYPDCVKLWLEFWISKISKHPCKTRIKKAQQQINLELNTCDLLSHIMRYLYGTACKYSEILIFETFKGRKLSYKIMKLRNQGENYSVQLREGSNSWLELCREVRHI